MKNLKLFTVSALATGFLILSNSFADTLTYKITGANSMTADWFSTTGGNLGTMTFTKTACSVTKTYYSVKCNDSVGQGLACSIFELKSYEADDWTMVYEQTMFIDSRTMTWQMYDIVKKAGGTKLFNLSSNSSNQIKEKENLLKSMKKAVHTAQ